MFKENKRCGLYIQVVAKVGLTVQVKQQCFCFSNSAILNYCDPSLMTNWRELDKSNGLENCREAMKIANEKYSIPMVVSPEDLSSKHMDELSGMTYFSYFLSHEGPGWYATLNWVRKNVPEEDVQNFKVSSAFIISVESKDKFHFILVQLLFKKKNIQNYERCSKDIYMYKTYLTYKVKKWLGNLKEACSCKWCSLYK